jgi:MFS-type transporter involved in bile tolerance (Atg22 family)
VIKKYHRTVHVDSMLIALPLFSYPFYLLLLAFLGYLFTGCWWAFLAIPMLPFTAWSYVQLKKQLDE